MTQITPEEHSDVVGGSTAARVINCPGSVKLVQSVKKAHKERILKSLVDRLGLSPSLTYDNMPAQIKEQVEEIYREETSNEFTKEGTGLHEAIAWILDNDEEGESVVDREFKGIHITPSRFSECIVPALDAFDTYLDRVFEEDGEDMEFQVEQRGEIPGVPGAFGTADIIGRTSKRMAVIDWKFGNGLVEAEDNIQLKFYARALTHSKPDWFKHPDFGADKEGQLPNNYQVDLVIVQPRRNGGEPDIFTTTYGDIESFRMDLVHAVSEALGDDPNFKRGDHCKYCDGKHVCPAFQNVGNRVLERVNQAIEYAADDIDEVADVDDISACIAEYTTQFTPEDLDQWVQDAREIQAWCDCIMKIAHTEAKAGRPPKGMKLVYGRSTEKWNDDYDVIDKRLGALGIPVKDRRKIKSITPNQARKMLDDVKLLKRLDKLTTVSDGPLKLVDINAKGDPVLPDAERMQEVGDKLKEFIEV